MSRGGARNRSGPPADPNSGRSDRRGLSFTALPSEGYQGEAPEFPLPPAELTGTRELEIWDEAWTTPQAEAWSREAWRWPILAEYCRLKATVELSPAATAALVSQLHRYRDQLGLTPAGLKENGWQIAADAVSARREAREEDSRPSATDYKSRFQVVNGE